MCRIAGRNGIHITIDGDYVSITTEVKRETEEKSGSATRALVRELYYGSAWRGFSLAQLVDSKAAIAKFKDGVLKLTLPKLAEAASRTRHGAVVHPRC